MAVIVVIVVILGAVQLFVRAVPPVRYVSTAPASFRVPGPAPVLPFPGQGEATVGLLGVGTMGSSGGDGPVPIASLTKMMTAYLILHDHPLTDGQEGPSLTVGAADVATEAADAAGAQSVVKVQAGEQLTEHQALEALLVASANNIGTLLAEWDAGSQAVFVSRMNTEAARLGMTATHYADPTGISSASVSSAGDQVRLAEVAMTNPVFAGIVDLAQVNLPVAGTVYNYDYLVGHDGIIGIKTGSTAQAGGCFVFAAIRAVGPVPIVVIGAVLGQQGPSILQAALNASLALINAAGAAVHPISLSLPADGTVARLSTAWSSPVPVMAPGTWSTIGWGGMTVGVSVSRTTPLAPVSHLTAGTRLGSVTLSLAGQHHTFPATLQATVPVASARWRLERL
ncbi:MAG: D-alanyl-D-alanine carboxypeptidase family protein [Acidimicrobiales bacterium]